MKLHEFHAKKIFRENGIFVPEGKFFSFSQNIKKTDLFAKFPLIIKSQVLAGGRGKAGLVKKVNSFDEILNYRDKFNKIVYKNEASIGVLIEEIVEHDTEYYISLLINKKDKNILLIFSSEGGVDIEEVGKNNSNKIKKISLPLAKSSLNDLIIKEFENEFNQSQLDKFIDFVIKLRDLFLKIDATLIEINPFIFASDDNIVALDAVIDIDDSAKFRQSEIFEFAATLQNENKKSIENPFGTHFVKLDGNIGIIGCGAGIVMASMDMINFFGGKPANFLDIGGGADRNKTIKALEFLNGFDNIKVIFINIFGGITDCLQIADALIDFRIMHSDCKYNVIRLMGNNSEVAIKKLKANGIFAYDSMEQAAQKAVELALKKESLFLISKNTNVLVQGITGKYGSYHTKKMLDYGTNIVAGVSPAKGGDYVYSVPVYNSIREAKQDFSIDATIIFVPAKFAKEAALEAISEKIPLVVIITEHIPVFDTIEIINEANKNDVKIIGPNCPGIIKVNEANIGIIPGDILRKGSAGIISRSGTLLYEVCYQLSKNSVGVSTAVGLGGDPVIGTSVVDIVDYYVNSDDIKYIVYIGEIGGGDDEIRLAEYIKKNNISKPIISFFAGKTAPVGAKMGHAGAIIDGEKSTVDYKIKLLSEAGCKIAGIPSEICSIINSMENRE